ncbi:MAG: hypothetical protein ACI92I_000516 [Acidimicrobiales bacterium]|jgi:hypothetical protein
MKFFFPFLIFVVAFLSDIGITFAAEGLVTCGGGDCNFCSFITMTNNIVEWLIIVATSLVVLILAYAGFRLITSGGNATALADAKKMLINAIIGIIIMLAGWTIVDTFLKVFAGGDLGVWNETDCGEMFESEKPVAYGIVSKAHNYLAPEFDDGSYTGGGSTKTFTGPGGTPIVASPCKDGITDLRTVNFLGRSVTVHKAMVASLGRIDAGWRAKGGPTFYPIRSMGGYSCRNVANSSNISNHSYGIAIDINAAQNPHNVPPRVANVCTTDMPPAFRDMFLREGWGWGCNWRSSKDAMHFSKATGEGGDMKGN